MKNIIALASTATLLAGLNSASAQEVPVIDEVRHNHFNACISYALKDVFPNGAYQSNLFAFRNGTSYEVFETLEGDVAASVSVEITGQGPETMHIKGQKYLGDGSRTSTYIILDKDNIFDFNAGFLSVAAGGQSSGFQEQVSDRTKAVLASIRDCRTPRP